MDDQKIIEFYWNHNEDALTHTRKKYHRYCYRIAYNLLQNHEEAEEAENDTYLGAWNAMPPHRPSNLPAFLGKSNVPSQWIKSDTKNLRNEAVA